MLKDAGPKRAPNAFCFYMRCGVAATTICRGIVVGTLQLGDDYKRVLMKLVL